MALGATAAQVRALVLRQAGVVIVIGLVTGTRRRARARTLAVLARLRDQSVGSSILFATALLLTRPACRGLAARTTRIASGAANRRGAVGLRVTALSPDGVDRCRPISPRLGSARAPFRPSPLHRSAAHRSVVKSTASGRAPPSPTAWSRSGTTILLCTSPASRPSRIHSRWFGDTRNIVEHRQPNWSSVTTVLARARPRGRGGSPGGSRCRSPTSCRAGSRPC